MMGVRKVLDRFFDKNELRILDDILPEFKRHEKLDDEEALELGVSYTKLIKYQPSPVQVYNPPTLTVYYPPDAI